MNFQDLMDKLFQETGHPDPNSDRPDYLVQQYRDALNAAMDEIAASCSPSMDFLVRESSIAVVPGQSDYVLNDWVQRPLSMWTEDIFAHKIRFRKPRAADWDGSRNTTLAPYVFGPYQVTLLPRTTIPFLSGVAGATTGASAAMGNLYATFGTSNPVLTPAVVGRMLRLNGESGDYLIVAQDGAHQVTLDRPVIARQRGMGVGGMNTYYQNVRWEIGPVGRYQVRFLPKPTQASTPLYRYMAYPRKLLNPSDTPELQEDMHHLIWKGALRAVAATKRDDAMYQMYTTEYAATLGLLKASDADDTDSSDGPHSERLGEDVGLGVLPGTYSRYGTSGY